MHQKIAKMMGKAVFQKNSGIKVFLGINMSNKCYGQHGNIFLFYANTSCTTLWPLIKHQRPLNRPPCFTAHWTLMINVLKTSADKIKLYSFFTYKTLLSCDVITFCQSSALKCVFPCQTTQIYMKAAFPTYSKYLIKNIYFDFLQKRKKST